MSSRGRPRGVNAESRGGLTHAEIALRVGLSMQRVQQLEKRALEKLAALLAERGLTFEDLGGER